MFRTELPIAPATGQLPRTARVLTVGSCFADSIGSRLVAHKVDALVNPFGTVFQPLALGRLLRAAAGEEVDWQQHLVEARGRWQSYDLHGSIGAASPVELLQTIQELVRRTGEFLRQADVVLLTLGTAWAYRLRETGELVSNCHKQPADLFVRELLTPDEIINNLAETHAYLRRINPELRFVLTVSPVRHLKDTLPLNSVSKSVLRVATHIVSDLLPGVAYFPAYELLVDDLRDYRFYAADMLHPSEVAEEYIWDKFARTYFDAEFGRFRKEWAAVRQSLGHRPLHAGAPEHRQFLESTLERLEQLSLRKVGVDAELREVRTQLAALPVPRQPEPVEVTEDSEERIDIGEGAAPVPTVSAAAPTSGEDALLAADRPSRLSPEEFRAQRAARSGRPERGRRDGRGKGQQQPVAENEPFQAAAAFDDASPLLLPPEQASAAAEQADPSAIPSAAPALPAADEAGPGDEPAKKKKRRSRGGAKRTARKHALRLAAGEVLPELATATDAAATPVDSEVTEVERSGRPEGEQSGVVTNSVPVKRGGRRNEAGAPPRVAPVAASPAPETPAAVGTALDLAASAAVPAGIGSGVTPAPEQAAVASRPSRNSRNRKKKGASATSTVQLTADEVAAAGLIDLEVSGAEGILGQPAGEIMPVSTSGRTQNRRQAQPASASEVPAPAPEAALPAAAPRRPSRAKARAVSGARAEKPAVDVPIIPVPDASRVRTQVAAGRMTGSSATLVAPAALLTKPGATKKATASKATASGPKAAKKATPVSPAPTATEIAAQPPTAATKPKPASKPKAKSAKAGAAKPKPVAKAKAATAAPTGEPAEVKAPAKKRAVKPAGPKPKPPGKPAKPA